MPRNSDGNYNLPSGTLVNSGDIISVSQHNPAMVDIQSALTNSLDRTGRGNMAAALGMGGNLIQNMAPGVSPNDAATVSQVQAIPLGVPMPYLGDTPPDDNYVFAYGQELSRAAYPAFYERFKSRLGTGNGTTTFNMFDYRGVVFGGLDNMGGAPAGRTPSLTTLGAVIGSADHVLTINEMPSHGHSINDIGHKHQYSAVTPFGGIGAGSSYGQSTGDTQNVQTGISLNNTGGGQAHNNVQPTVGVNIIVKVR